MNHERSKEATMSKSISETTLETMRGLGQYIDETVRACHSLEEAAQKFVNVLFEEFEESIVLIRMFATIPFGTLSASNQRIVTTFKISTLKLVVDGKIFAS
jgi:hypothetical protein